MNRFVFIAVNYNGSKYTTAYVNSINNIDLGEFDLVEIIIVDNRSDSDDLRRLEGSLGRVENVTILKSGENLGYFKGLNQGIRSVSKDDDTVLIVGNNDLTFDCQFIHNLNRIKYDKDVLVIAPNIVTKEGRQQNPHVVDKVKFVDKIKNDIYFSNYYVGQVLRFLNQTLRRLVKKTPVLQNDFKKMKIKRGIGACYVLTPNFFRNFKELDDSVFMWGEEALLSNQVESVGGTTLYDPTIVIKHHESASVSSIQSKDKYYMVKKSYNIYRKYL